MRYLEAPGPIDTLILGSSKAKHFSPAVVLRHGRRAFNFWLMNARVEDWYCALRFALDHPKGRLSLIVLAMDVESFSNVVDLDVRLRVLSTPDAIPGRRAPDEPSSPPGVRRDRSPS